MAGDAYGYHTNKNGSVNHNYYSCSIDKGSAGQKSLYGNLGVLNLKHWQGVHRLMRCDLAFSNKVNYNSNTAFKTIYQPAFIKPNGNMDDDVYYPSTTKELTFKYKPIKSNGTH